MDYLWIIYGCCMVDVWIWDDPTEPVGTSPQADDGE